MGGGSSQDAYFEIRKTLYSRYEAELNSIFERSKFIWTFIAILFSAYGLLLNQYYIQKSSAYANGHLALTILLIQVLGLLSSILWIALAKASAALEESFVKQIEILENYPLFTFPRDWSLWTSYKGCATDQNFLSRQEGQFSSKKINILIAQMCFFIWSGLLLFHIISLPLYKETIVLIAVFCILVVWLFQRFVKNKCKSSWLEKPKPDLDNVRKMLLLIDLALNELPQTPDFESLNKYYLKHIKVLDMLFDHFNMQENDQWDFKNQFGKAIKDYAVNGNVDCRKYAESFKSLLNKKRQMIFKYMKSM